MGYMLSNVGVAIFVPCMGPVAIEVFAKHGYTQKQVSCPNLERSRLTQPTRAYPCGSHVHEHSSRHRSRTLTHFEKLNRMKSAHCTSMRMHHILVHMHV